MIQWSMVKGRKWPCVRDASSKKKSRKKRQGCRGSIPGTELRLEGKKNENNSVNMIERAGKNNHTSHANEGACRSRCFTPFMRGSAIGSRFYQRRGESRGGKKNGPPVENCAACLNIRETTTNGVRGVKKEKKNYPEEQDGFTTMVVQRKEEKTEAERKDGSKEWSQ